MPPTTAQCPARTATLPWIALGVVYLVWSSTYLGIRFLIESAPALLAGGARFLCAGLVLAVIVTVIAGPGALRFTRPQLGTAVLVGLLLPACGQGLIMIAEHHVASGLTALLVACMPLYVVLLRRALGERPHRVTMLGVGLGLGGLAVLVLAGAEGGSAGVTGNAWWGPWLVLLAVLGWSIGSVASTRLPTPPNPFALAAVEMLVGGVALAVVGLLAGERWDLAATSTSSWIAWGYLVVFGSLLAFSSYVYVLGRLPVSTVATYTYVNPMIAVLLGVLLAGERFSAVQLGGGLLVLLAVVLVIRAERPPQPEPVTTGPAAEAAAR
ncbi:MAG: EamA family transporter [Pseudonocardiaceae bacterium]